MTRGQLPQRAGLPGLNGSGAAAAVPPCFFSEHSVYIIIRLCLDNIQIVFYDHCLYLHSTVRLSLCHSYDAMQCTVHHTRVMVCCSYLHFNLCYNSIHSDAFISPALDSVILMNMRQTSGQPHLSAIVQARHFSLFGHIVQMPKEADAKRILTASPWRTGGDHSEALVLHG